ncbi:hypothetical protein I8J29_09380 [Paenibacillus sp. MWE-103]|uniref:ABC-2 type transport system permease protein n=1 Tax=Paenibacillus artemisiicola TaxID=1172618 RepID=A0ABS3W7W7_9BACL|nr:hypothetical protein [Paenibacillus artemisiicola]MBO7744405.1 hypothetical protein [Paenibacillus artemisiicola]
MWQWSALFMKDFKLTRTVFFIGLVLNAWVAILTLYMEKADSLLMFVPLAIAIAVHVIYVPLMVFIGLKAEGNLHLWLSNPQPAFKLLMSKVSNGLAMVVISFASLYAFTELLTVHKLSWIESYWTDIWRMGWFIIPHVIWLSIELSVWVMALWAIYQSLKQRIGRWSWAAVVGAAILSGGGNALFKSSALYRHVADWGGRTYHFPALLSEPIHTYAGGYVYDMIITVGLFILTAWIVDNKVEG